MIIVDLETSGVSPYKHSILSIGALDFRNPENQFYAECQIWPGAAIQPESLAVNGFTKQQATDQTKDEESSIVKDYYDWVKQFPEKTFAGQNTAFDRGFMRAAFKRAGLQWTLGYRGVDLHSIAYGHVLKHKRPMPQKNGKTSLSLDAILVYVGVPEEPKPHNAMTGAKMEAEAFHRLIHNEPLFDEFKKYPVPDYLA